MPQRLVSYGIRLAAATAATSLLLAGAISPAIAAEAYDAAEVVEDPMRVELFSLVGKQSAAEIRAIVLSDAPASLLMDSRTGQYIAAISTDVTVDSWARVK